MRFHIKLCIQIASIGLFAIAGITMAQEVPRLAGDWLSTDGPQRLHIDLNPAEFVVTRPVGDHDNRMVYRFDGVEGRNETHTVTGELWMHESSEARWIGNAILVSNKTTRTAAGSTGGQREWLAVYYLTARDTLTVTLIDRSLGGSAQIMVPSTSTYTRQNL